MRYAVAYDALARSLASFSRSLGVSTNGSCRHGRTRERGDFAISRHPLSRHAVRATRSLLSSLLRYGTLIGKHRPANGLS